MDSNITQFIIERRAEMAFFPVVVFGYLSITNQSLSYSISTGIVTVSSPIFFHWLLRAFGGLDPTQSDDSSNSLLEEIPINSPIRMILLFIFTVPYMILFLFGIPVALFLNFSFDDPVIVALTLFYVIFVVSSQGHRFFNDESKENQKTLSDFE